MQLVDALKRIVKGNDRPVAGISLDIVEHVLGCYPLGIVAGDDIPHDDAILAVYPPIDRGPHPAVGRSEEMGVDELVGLDDIEGIGNAHVLERTQVVEGMVAHLVALLNDAVVQVMVSQHVLAHHKEGGAHSELPQRVENKGCGLRERAVVEREIDGLLVRVHSPHGFRVKPAQKRRGLLDKHDYPSALGSTPPRLR